VSLTAEKVPAVQPEPRALKIAMLERSLTRLRRATWVLSAFSCVLLVLTVATWIIASQMWGMLAETRELAGKLENISGFEKRVVSRLDNFNVGVQSLIDKTNGRLGQIQSEAEKASKLSQDSAQRIRIATDQLEMRMNSFAMQPGLEEQVDYEPPSQPVTRSAPGRVATAASAPAANQPPASAGEPAAQGSQSFRRITNADGSVTYEKVR
jgi:hypothetical protein